MVTQNSELAAVVQELEAEFGSENLAKARYQARMNRVSSMISLAVALIVVLFWLPTGWAAGLRDALQANASWWRRGAALLVFLLLEEMLALPLAWYFGFRVENRLGTNRQRFGGWLADEFKQHAMNIIVQSLMFLGVYEVFRRWPTQWFWGLVVVSALFLLSLYLLSPLLLRMQYKAQPLEEPDLTDRIRRLFEKAGVPFGKLAVLKASEKTSRGTAALVPKGAGTEVVFFDTLLDALSPEAIEVVVAHELGHKVHRDMAKQLLLMGGMLLLGLGMGYLAVQAATPWAGLQGATDVATFPLLALVLSWSVFGLNILQNALSRKMERAADRFALEATGNPQAFEETMKVLAKQNKTLPQPPRWEELLFHNHPSIARRILTARRWQPTPQPKQMP